MLTALAGCTGMDVVSLLDKMKVRYETFTIEISALLTDEHPKYYDKVHLIYGLKPLRLTGIKLRKLSGYRMKNTVESELCLKNLQWLPIRLN